MAGSTTNLNLIKPTYEEDADIADINANMDIIDIAANAIEKGIAIVSNNNTHAAIASGSYVYVRNHGSLSEGLYTANTNISANATLSSSNLAAVSGGGMNVLSDGLNTLNSKIANIDTSTTISDLTNIPVNTKGRIKLAGSISPTGGGQTVDYVCIGSNTDRTLIIDYIANGTTYINRYSSSSWSGWDSFALNSKTSGNLTAETNVSFASGFNNKATKCNNVVTVEFALTASASIQSTVNVARVPSGFRPEKEIRSACYYTDGFARFGITAGGYILTYTPMESGKTILGIVTYII